MREVDIESYQKVLDTLLQSYCVGWKPSHSDIDEVFTYETLSQKTIEERLYIIRLALFDKVLEKISGEMRDSIEYNPYKRLLCKVAIENTLHTFARSRKDSIEEWEKNWLDKLTKTYIYFCSSNQINNLEQAEVESSFSNNLEQAEAESVFRCLYEILLPIIRIYSGSPPKDKIERAEPLPTEWRDKYPQRLEPDTETVYEALSRASRGIGKEGTAGLWLLNTDKNHLFYTSRHHKDYIALLVPSEGEEVAFLEALLKSGSLQAARALNYIYGVLIGDGVNTPDTPKARIRLDDIAENVWGSRRVTIKEQAERRAKVWKWFQMFRAMKIVGQRSGWNDFKTNAPAPYIHANILVISDEEYDDLYGENPPRSVLVALLSDFAVMLGRKFGCYLEGAEKMKEIGSGKPSGALAHSLYISLNSFWKRHKNLDSKPTRRELVDRNDMEGVKSFIDYLNNKAETKEPDRALGFWIEALKLLEKNGIIDTSSEELKFKAENVVKISGWRDSWLNEQVDIRPAEFIRSQLAPLAKKEQIKAAKTIKKPATNKTKSEEYSPL